MILCCGEAVIDMIPGKMQDGRTGFIPHSGGASLNTAIALGRVGARAGLLSGLSNDLFGEILVDAMAKSHVDTRLVIRSDRPTTLSFVHLNDGHATYTIYDENSAGRMLRPDHLPELPDDIGALLLGGISLACEPCADTYAALAEREQGARVIMLDPNIRPGFITDEARYRDRLARMLALADIVKVSDEDLHWIYPGNTSTEDTAQRLLATGPLAIIVTRGGEGASAWLHDGSHLTVPAQPAQVADTVGAGDTFNAGILSSLSDQGLLSRGAIATLSAEHMETAMKRAAQMAAITVSRPGADPPWRHEIE